MPDDKDRLVASGSQASSSLDSPFGGTVGTTTIGGSLFASGFIPYGNKGGRVWDQYLKGLRIAEAASPGAVLRTFKISEMLSPLESYSPVEIGEDRLRGSGKYGEFLRSQFGKAGSFTLKPSSGIVGSVFADGKEVGLGVQMMGSTQSGVGVSDYFARVTGTELKVTDSLNESLLRAKYSAEKPNVPFKTWVSALAPSERRDRLILGVPFREEVRGLRISSKTQRMIAKGEIGIQMMRANAATAVGRLNTLLSKPLEMPGTSSIISKIPGIGRLPVKPGTAGAMTMRYAGRGLAIGAAWKGLEYFDYLTANNPVAAPVAGVLGGAALGGFLFKGPGSPFSKAGLVGGAALGLFSSLAPRFHSGFFHGAASTVTDANIARAQASEITGLQRSLRRQEEVTPGLVSGKTALAFAGIGGLLTGLHGYGSTLVEGVNQYRKTGGNLADVFEMTREAKATSLGEKVWSSSIGKKIASLPGGKYVSKVKNRFGLGMMAGLAAWTAVSSGLSLLSGNIMAAIPGLNLLGSEETSEELEDIYSGRKEVEIRKGRWWEMGRSAIEGGRIDYYRPSFLARLKSRAYQKGIYGDEEEKWDYDPVLHPLKALFGSDDWKYHYEKKYAMERPAPFSSSYGSEIPFIGPLVAETFGKLFKPRKKIREEEWNLGGGEYADLPGDHDPAYELGGLKPGAPVGTGDLSQMFNELLYRQREMVGLVGFGQASLQKAITGREETFENERMAETMGGETGAQYWLWKHLNVGGLAGSSELTRRFLPTHRSYLEKYNPLENTQASWLPDDYIVDFKHGNPFSKIAEAEIRLPGTGYAAMNPDVEGLDPEDYPLAHRVKILGDVAMHSQAYRNEMTKAKRELTRMSDRERSIILSTEKQVNEKKVRREFTDYNFDPSLLRSQDVTVTDIMGPGRIKTAEYGDLEIDLQGIGDISDRGAAMGFAEQQLSGGIQLMMPSMDSRAFGAGSIKAVAMVGGQDYGSMLAKEGYASYSPLDDEFHQLRFSSQEQMAGKISETILHGIETPFEYLTPLAPGAKLIHQRSPIEEYIASEAIGTSSAFWDKPIQNFITPALNMAQHAVSGSLSIPEEVQQRRDINRHYDMLAWVKSKRLERIARAEGDESGIMRQSLAQRKTLFGADLSNLNAAIQAMPRKEKDFYHEFVQAKSMEDRKKILALVPENERRIYMSQWLRQEGQAAFAKKQAKIATSKDDQMIVAAQKLQASAGFGYTGSDEEDYMAETQGKVPFDDWLRNRKAREYFATHPLPSDDWIGYNPAVDMEDIKLKQVDMSGLDYHNFDMWSARASSLDRKPYITANAASQVNSGGGDYDKVAKTRLNAQNIGKLYGGNSSVQMTQVDANVKERYDFQIKDRRESLVNESYRRFGA